MLLFAAALAHAGLRADLDREAQGAPQLALACSSAHAALARFRDTAAELGGGPGPVPPGLDDFLGGIEGVLAPDARLTIAWWESSSALRLGFETPLGPGELAEAFARLDPDAGGQAFQGPDGWGIREADGDVISVAVDNGWARVTHGPAPVVPPRTLPAPLLAALPDGDGCAILVHVDDDDLGGVDFGLHIALADGQPATFAVALPMLKDSDAILLEGAVPPRAATTEVPEAVLVLGVGLDSVDFSTFLQGKELRQARRLQSHFPITGGTTLAVLATEPSPRVAAVLPIARNMPARRIARRTRALARKLDLEVERTDATSLVLRSGVFEVLAAAAPGRLYLATDPGTLNALQKGDGEPWVSGTVAGLAAEWPLVVATSVLPAAGGVPGRVLPRPLFLALDLDDGVVRGLLDVPLSLGELARIAAAVRAARGAEAEAAPPNVEL